MSKETISVVYEKLDSIAGKGYYHETLLYTDANGQQSLASSYPSARDVPIASFGAHNVSQPLTANTSGDSSIYGILTTTVGPISNYSKEQKDGWLGAPTNPYPSEVVASGDDLSQQWAAIDQANHQIGSEKLPYSPSTLNSNSAASTELAAAGISLPTDNGISDDH
ncbi:MAG: hypothetical protein HQL37_01715, partial [Alphaproteobacteria bacterium]|nr:hypothetical protein [Alphaproteobacteria bacterium]